MAPGILSDSSEPHAPMTHAICLRECPYKIADAKVCRGIKSKAWLQPLRLTDDNFIRQLCDYVIGVSQAVLGSYEGRNVEYS